MILIDRLVDCKDDMQFAYRRYNQLIIQSIKIINAIANKGSNHRGCHQNFWVGQILPPSLDPLSSPLPFLPPLPFPSISLKVGPLNRGRGLGAL